MTRRIPNKVTLMIAVGIIGLLALLAVIHKADRAVEAGARLNAIGAEIRNDSRQVSEYSRTKDFEKTRLEAAKVAALLARIEGLCDEGARIAPLETDRERLLTIRRLATSDVKSIAGADVVFEEGSRQLENASDEVVKAVLNANRQSLASSATAVWVAIQLVVLSAVGAIGAVTAYDSRISASIVRPVTVGQVNFKVKRTLRRRRQRSPALSSPPAHGGQILPG